MSEILDRSSEIGKKFLAWTPETGPCPISINDNHWFKKLCGLFEIQASLEARTAQLEAHLKDRDTWLKNNRDYIDELEKKNIALKRELSTAETSTAANTIFMARKDVEIAQLKATAVDDKFKIMCLERRVKELEEEIKLWESTH